MRTPNSRGSKSSDVREMAIKKFSSFYEGIKSEKKDRIKYLRFLVQSLDGNLERYIVYPDALKAIKIQLNAAGKETSVTFGVTSTAYKRSKNSLRAVEKFLKEK
jgi:hypothetical protein